MIISKKDASLKRHLLRGRGGVFDAGVSYQRNTVRADDIGNLSYVKSIKWDGSSTV